MKLYHTAIKNLTKLNDHFSSQTVPATIKHENIVSEDTKYVFYTQKILKTQSGGKLSTLLVFD